MLRVKLEITRGLIKKLGPGEAGKVADKLTAALARSLGGSIRERVQGQGNLAGQPVPQWSSKKRTKLVSAKYPDGVTGKLTPSGAESFPEGSQAYHQEAGAKRGAISVSGGTWAGLSLVIWSEIKSELRFRGRSDGQDARIIGGKSRPIKISNSLKAWTAFSKLKVQFMAVSDRELVATTEAATQAAALMAASVLPITFSTGAPSSLDVNAIFQQALGTRNPVR